MFKTRIRLKTITTTAEENTYLASFTPEKGDGYVFISDGKAVQKIYDGTKWNSSSLGDVTETEMNAAIESVRLQVTESSTGNLVVKSLGVAPVSYSNAVTTTEIKTYTYDGNYSADGIVGAHAMGESQPLSAVKVGELPSGTLSFVGQAMEGKSANNSWLNWETTITSDMIDTSQTGATIINYQNGEKESLPITRAVIVSTAGNYNLTYSHWTAYVTFTETGIYLIESREVGTDDYTTKLCVQVTSSSGENNSGDSSTVANNINYAGNEILMFNKGICIGDSITSGTFNYGSNGDGVRIQAYSYPTILSKRGLTVANAGIPGCTTAEWNDSRLNGASHYSGSWAENGDWLQNNTGTSSLDLSPYDFAIIHLGINDCANNVDTTTFASNLGTILGALKNANSKISIFLCTLTPAYSSANSAMSTYNEVIRALVPAMKDTMNIHLIDLAQYSKCLPNTAYVNTHLTALGYTQMANEIYAMISYTINQNLNDFKNVQFNGTNYSV